MATTHSWRRGLARSDEAKSSRERGRERAGPAPQKTGWRPNHGSTVPSACPVRGQRGRRTRKLLRNRRCPHGGERQAGA
eukprot:8828097-Pyramimonas_sp.AAC.1